MLIECVDGSGWLRERIGEPAGDRSVVPAGRRYVIRIRIDGPVAVSVAGHGALPPVAGPTEGAAGWGGGADGLTRLRPPPPPPPAGGISPSPLNTKSRGGA